MTEQSSSSDPAQNPLIREGAKISSPTEINRYSLKITWNDIAIVSTSWSVSEK
jgi:hypothetical protein